MLWNLLTDFSYESFIYLTIGGSVTQVYQTTRDSRNLLSPLIYLLFHLVPVISVV